MADEVQERVFEFRPAVGMRFHFTQTAEDTGGAFLEAEQIIAPFDEGPPVHMHPHQEDRYTVVAGILDVYVDGKLHRVGAGESLAVPKGTPHTLKNSQGEEVRLINRHTPAMNFQGMMATLHRLVLSGKVKSLPPRDLSSVIYLSLLFMRYKEDVVSVKPPSFVMAAMAFLGRRLGYRLP